MTAPQGQPAEISGIDVMRGLGEVIDRQFGPGCGKAVLPDGHFALMNKAPALDRMDEVIVDGRVAGTIYHGRLVHRLQSDTRTAAVVG